MPASSRFRSKPPAQMVSELLDAPGGPASGSAPGVTRFRAIGYHEPFPLWVWQPTITFYCGGQKERMTRQALPVELRSADDVTRQPVTESVASGRTEPSKSRSKWSAGDSRKHAGELTNTVDVRCLPAEETRCDPMARGAATARAPQREHRGERISGLASPKLVNVDSRPGSLPPRRGSVNGRWCR